MSVKVTRQSLVSAVETEETAATARLSKCLAQIESLVLAHEASSQSSSAVVAGTKTRSRNASVVFRDDELKSSQSTATRSALSSQSHLPSVTNKTSSRPPSPTALSRRESVASLARRDSSFGGAFGALRSRKASFGPLNRGVSFFRRSALEILDVSGCLLHGQGLKTLAAALEGPSAIRIGSLSLLNNFLDASDAPVIRDLISECGAARTVSLACNCLEDEAVAIIAEGLTSHGHLERIDLSHNLIGDDGAAALASCLTAASSLRSVALRANRITNVGVEAIIGELANTGNTHTLHIAVECNIGISQQSYAALRAILTENQRRHVESKLAGWSKGPFNLFADIQTVDDEPDIAETSR